MTSIVAMETGMFGMLRPLLAVDCVLVFIMHDIKKGVIFYKHHCAHHFLHFKDEKKKLIYTKLISFELSLLNPYSDNDFFSHMKIFFWVCKIQ